MAAKIKLTSRFLRNKEAEFLALQIQIAALRTELAAATAEAGAARVRADDHESSIKT
jgi:hypothetical protein